MNSKRSFFLSIVVAVVLGVAYVATAAPGITWANFGADGGDLVAAVAVSGVPHPTGYPTYVLLGRLFLSIPFGEPAFRVMLLSLVATALAGGLAAFLFARTARDRSWGSILAGLAVGLTFGLAPLPWSQAVIAEVHGLNAFFLALALLLAAALSDPDRTTRSRLVVFALGLVCGLALGNHLTFVLVLPAVAVALWHCCKRESARLYFGAASGFALGLLVYLYLPLAARAHPPVNWGDASSWDGFWWLVSGGPYRGLAFALPLNEIPGRIAAWAGLLLDQFGIAGVILGAVGLVYGRSRLRWLDLTAGWIVFAYSVFALGYHTADSLGYLIPAYLGFSWWVGLGILKLAESVSDVRWRAGLLVPVLALAALLLRVPGTAAEVDASDDRRAADFAAQVMAGAPEDAIVLTDGTEDTFALWYAHFALGQRPDLHVVAAPLAQFEWYRQGLQHTYPGLALPGAGQANVELWVDELLSANTLPVCRTQVTREIEALSVVFKCEP